MNDRPEQLDWPEPVQDEMSSEDLTMIVWEMKKDPDYEAKRARRVAAINTYRDHILSFGPIQSNLFKLIRDDDDKDSEA